MRKNVFATVIALVGLAVVLGVVLSFNRPVSTTAAEPTATPFVIVQPTIVPTAAAVASASSRADRVAGMKFSGNLVSASQAGVAFQMGGRVKILNIKEGDRVKAGAHLITLDTSVLDLQVAQAQAAFDLAKANFDKVKAGPTEDDVTMAKSNVDRAKATLDQAQAAFDRAGGQTNPFIAMTPQSATLQQAYSAYSAALAQFNQTTSHPTDSELRIVTAQLAQAQAALDLAKQNVINATLVAPIDGTVIALTPKVGEMVGANAPVVTIADLAKMQVQINLDETSLSGIKLNQPVMLTLEALAGQSLAGHVSKIAWQGSTAGNIVSVPVTIDLDPTEIPIYPGLSALVSFQTR